MKLARRATGRSDIIAFVGGFHGRTYGALSLTASKATYRRGMGPLLPGIHHIRYPYCFRYCTHADGDVVRPRRARAGAALRHDDGPGDRGRDHRRARAGRGRLRRPAGDVHAHAAPGLRRARDPAGRRRGAERVRLAPGGCSRSSTPRVEPDIMCLAKALGNGMPIAAIVAGAPRHERVPRGRARHHLRWQRGRVRSRDRRHRDDDPRAHPGASRASRPHGDGTGTGLAGRHSRARRRARPWA